MLDFIIALPFIALLSALLWAANPLLLPLGWGIVVGVAIWDGRRKIRR